MRLLARYIVLKNKWRKFEKSIDKPSIVCYNDQAFKRERQTILENDTENEQEAKQSIREKLSETLGWLKVLAHLRLIEIVD